MNVCTQTPRRLYKRETDRELQILTVKLEKLEKELLARSSKDKQNNKQLIRKDNHQEEWKTHQNKIQIGPNGTQISKKMYLKVDLTSHRETTRDLCYMIFGKKTLGTHTLTGREGPGTVCGNRKKKEKLEPALVEDIVYHVQSRFDVHRAQILHAIRLCCRNAARSLVRTEG